MGVRSSSRGARPDGERRRRGTDRGDEKSRGEPRAQGGGAAELFTVDQLARISQNPDPDFYDLAGDRAALVPEMKKAGVVSKKQIAAFLANISQETDHLKTLEEYGTEAY